MLTVEGATHTRIPPGRNEADALEALIWGSFEVLQMAASQSLTPAQRTLRARMGCSQVAGEPENGAARTEAARRAAMDRFEHQVDPRGVLDPAVRAQRAEHARKAHFTGTFAEVCSGALAAMMVSDPTVPHEQTRAP